jgi:formate hydrogenlyase subunit 3/multisubunit Na+/H+ antiporter MnhD subunit
MPPAALLLPPALLAAAAVAGWALEAAGVDPRGAPAAVAAWLALAVVSADLLAGGRSALELTAPAGAGGVAATLRLDTVTLVFWLVVLVPVALLMTFQRRSAGEAALAALATATALVSLAAGSLLLSAFGLGACASLVMVLLRQEEVRATTACWVALTGTWLLLAWTAVLLQVASGTSAYGAVPVTALSVPMLALLALAALLCSGLLPWRTWVSEVWTRRRLESGTLAVALVVPLGFAPLVRAYGMGAGQLPGGQLGLVLSGLGAATALGAAIRAQAAGTRRGFLAEAVPIGAGMTLLGLGLGTPLGVVAALVALAGVAVAAGLAPLAAGARGWLFAVAAAVLVGVPPALVFGGWLLAAQAAVEAGTGPGSMGLAAVVAWVLAVAAAARSVRLPAGDPAASRPGPVVAVAIAVAGGVGLTALLAFVAIPAAAEVMPPAGRSGQSQVSAAAILSMGSLAVSTASGAWPAALLGGPLAVLGLAGAALARALRRGTGPELVSVAEPVAPVPEPLLRPPLAGLPERVGRAARSFGLPEQYRSLFRPAALEQAATSGRPWFWVAATIALAIAVTR